MSTPSKWSQRSDVSFLRLALGFLLLASSGCTQSPTEPDAVSRRTAIQVVGTSSCTTAPSLSLPVVLDGAQVALLSVPGEVTVDTYPGTHSLQLGGLTAPSQTVQVSPGSIATVKVAFVTVGCTQ